MIAFLNGTIIDKKDSALVVDVSGVGYEVFCAKNTIENLGETGAACRLFIHTQYRSEGAALFGFISAQEKELFLSLIKVDSVGPKSALNIMSGASWFDLAHLIEEGDVASLTKLPKVSKKTAEHVVVKLKGKLSELILDDGQNAAPTTKLPKSVGVRKMRAEVQSALTHLGYKPYEIERTLDGLEEDVWMDDIQSVIRSALNGLSGNI
ncbi:MAG: Holliday junction branch migration protein RuvA [Oligoflexia bacterium]|nr:Holliday junction branch migration protein RuvA [Oligoflexia bacterium]